jgi:hypothetical protein
MPSLPQPPLFNNLDPSAGWYDDQVPTPDYRTETVSIEDIGSKELSAKHLSRWTRHQRPQILDATLQQGIRIMEHEYHESFVEPESDEDRGANSSWEKGVLHN